MKVLVLNSGSSSIKFKLFDLAQQVVIASGGVERIGEASSQSTIRIDETAHKEYKVIASHTEALEMVRSMLRRSKAIEDFSTLDAIGHRVVHGGETLIAPMRITEEVADAIETLSSLAPLHNPANARGIRAMQKIAPGVAQVAVFDTAFHHTMPEVAYRYALPEIFYKDLHIRRYGFHGTSHRFVAEQAAKRLGKPLEQTNLITLHLGNGASVCAIKEGKSVDTSMGMTPLEGLIMGTRSGDVDPGALFYLMRETRVDNAEADRMLNTRSGLKGICGTNDMREIETRMQQGDEQAKLAFDMFVYRLRKYIGAYAVVLGQLDAIVFTGGIGEHSARVREAVCRELEVLGITLDEAANRADRESIGTGRVALFVVATDEELSIAQQCREVLDA